MDFPIAVREQQLRPSKMNQTLVPTPNPMVYEICVPGLLDENWSVWFGGMKLRHDREGNTLLAGAVPDQAALYGILLQLRDLGLPLISLQRLGWIVK
jgi:hypothetical protein